MFSWDIIVRAQVQRSGRFGTLEPPMSLDATFLLALISLAVAGVGVGVCGWILFVRDHRAWKLAHAHPDAAEER
jgi:cytochrome c-type biogenesis protein CcmH/NrfF